MAKFSGCRTSRSLQPKLVAELNDRNLIIIFNAIKLVTSSCNLDTLPSVDLRKQLAGRSIARSQVKFLAQKILRMLYKCPLTHQNNVCLINKLQALSLFHFFTFSIGFLTKSSKPPWPPPPSGFGWSKVFFFSRILVRPDGPLQFSRNRSLCCNSIMSSKFSHLHQPSPRSSPFFSIEVQLI